MNGKGVRMVGLKPKKEFASFCWHLQVVRRKHQKAHLQVVRPFSFFTSPGLWDWLFCFEVDSAEGAIFRLSRRPREWEPKLLPVLRVVALEGELPRAEETMRHGRRALP